MANKRGLGWLARGALLAGALIVPACTDSTGASNPGLTGALWNSTSGAVGGAGGVTLLWNDPNTGPTGPGGGGGDLTFGQADPMLFPSKSPDAPHPVVVNNPQDQNASNEENTVEGSASAYHASLQNGGAGGFGGVGAIGGIGAIGGFNNIPPFYSGNAKLRSVARAHCKHLTIHATPDEPTIIMSPYIPWLMDKATVNNQEANEAWFPVQATTAAGAWNAMNPGAKNWISGMGNPGWAGAGFWNNGTTWYNLLMCELPSGQVP